MEECLDSLSDFADVVAFSLMSFCISETLTKGRDNRFQAEMAAFLFWMSPWILCQKMPTVCSVVTLQSGGWALAHTAWAVRSASHFQPKAMPDAATLWGDRALSSVGHLPLDDPDPLKKDYPKEGCNYWSKTVSSSNHDDTSVTPKMRDLFRSLKNANARKDKTGWGTVSDYRRSKTHDSQTQGALLDWIPDEGKKLLQRLLLRQTAQFGYVLYHLINTILPQL